MVVKGYTLCFLPKAREAEAAAKGDEDLLLALYDKRAGRIEKDGVLVPTGTFWDSVNGVRVEKKAAPKVEAPVAPKVEAPKKEEAKKEEAPKAK